MRAAADHGLCPSHGWPPANGTRSGTPRSAPPESSPTPAPPDPASFPQERLQPLLRTWRRHLDLDARRRCADAQLAVLPLPRVAVDRRIVRLTGTRPTPHQATRRHIDAARD